MANCLSKQYIYGGWNSDDFVEFNIKAVEVSDCDGIVPVELMNVRALFCAQQLFNLRELVKKKESKCNLYRLIVQLLLSK